MSRDRKGEGLGWVSDDPEFFIKDDTQNEAPVIDTTNLNIETVDEIFEQIGACGRYQLIQAFALSLLNVPIAFPLFLIYFTGHSPNWRCVNGTNLPCNFTGEISPADVNRFALRCSMPRQSWEYVNPRNFSFITEFDLVCDKNPMAALTFSAVYIGWGIGSIPLGIAADYFGRKPVLVVSYVLILSFVLASAFLTSVWQYVVLRAATGFLFTGYGMSSFSLGSEIVGTKFRSFIGPTILGVGTAGVLFLTLQAYFIQEWRKLSLWCSAPYLGFVLLFCFINESPRWLRSQGQLDKSTKIMKQIAAINRRPYPSQQIVENSDSRRLRGNFINLFRPAKQLMKTIPLSFGWMNVALMFYGLSLAASDLTGKMYRDFALITAVEFPGLIITILSLEKLGRRRSSVATMVGAGIFCISIAMFPANSERKIYATLRIAAGMVGKLCNVVAFGALYVWTGELYPTSIRTQGLSFSSLSARVGAAAAPFLTETLKLINPALPFIIMGSISILSGLLSLALPETLGKQTLESVDDDLTESRQSDGNAAATWHINTCYDQEDTCPYQTAESEALMQPDR